MRAFFRSLILIVTLCFGTEVWAVWPASKAALSSTNVSPRIAPVDCELFAAEPGAQHHCAFFVSPMNHEHSTKAVLGTDGAIVRLPVVVISATPGVNSPTAVLVAGGGGPGNSLGMGHPGYQFEDLSAGVSIYLRAGMDVVLVDQRGTGLSEPQLNCPELGQTYQKMLGQTVDEARINHAVEQSLMQCRQRAVALGVDLSSYDSRASAQDFLELMHELPYRHWVVMGVSYGALLAYEMAAQAPEQIDALILDSLPGLEQEGRYLSAHDLRQRVQKIIDDCLQQATCARRYPRLSQQFQQLLDQFAAAPVQLSMNAGGSILVDDNRLLRILFNAAYWPEYIAYLPYVINAVVADEQLEPLAWIANDYYSWMTDTQYGDILHTNIFCEVTLPLQQERLERFPELQKAWNKADHIAWQSSVNLCLSWNVEPDYGRHVFPVVLPTPSLVLSGGLDPVTPSDDALGMQHWLMNSRVVIDPEAAHALLFSPGCAQLHVWRFINDLKLSGQTQQKCYSQPISFH